MAQRRLHAEHQIEKVGKDLRNMMPWLKGADDLAKD
jgi:ketol-acid reductoisomerase